jgi:hypothetical protein
VSPILGVLASGITKSKLVTGAYESIASATGTGSSGTITFSSIPSTYTSLQIRYIARDTGTGAGSSALRIRLNSDSGANYSYHSLIGDGSAVTASGTASSTEYLISRGVVAGGALATTLCAGVIDIHDYASTTRNKTMRGFTGDDTNSASGFWGVNLSSGLWMSTSAVNAIELRIFSDSFTTSTTVALYGIKGS